MREVQANGNLVAYCGLYCGACRSYLKESCPGCHENAKATWCKIKTCVSGKGIASCADCTEFENVKDCKKFNNGMSKLFGLLFNSNRAACIDQIKSAGLDGHAKIMAEAGTQSIRAR
jgi:hypothetical protein